MSIEMMVGVLHRSRSKGAARLVLLAMANEAHSSGHLTAYKRSQSHLARMANVSERSVRDAVRELEALGELEVLKRGDGRAQSDYLITLPRAEESAPLVEAPGRKNLPPSPEESAPQDGENCPPGGAQIAAPSSRSSPVLPVPPSPPVASAPSVPTNLLGEREARRSAPGAQTRQEKNFAAFWRSYPEPQCSEPEARRLFTAATRRARAADIVAGLDRWAAHWAEHGYPMGAVRWLKGDYWAEPVPTVKAKPSRFPEPPPPEYLFKDKPEPTPEASAEDKADTRARQARQRIIRQKSQAARARGDLDESRRLFRLNLDTWAEPLSVTAEDILARPAAEPEPVSA